jgi:hypothetical protein
MQTTHKSSQVKSSVETLRFEIGGSRELAREMRLEIRHLGGSRLRRHLQARIHSTGSAVSEKSATLALSGRAHMDMVHCCQ